MLHFFEDSESNNLHYRDELEKQLSGKELEFVEEVPTKNILEFGGRKGSTTTCMVFKRL